MRPDRGVSTARACDCREAETEDGKKGFSFQVRAEHRDRMSAIRRVSVRPGEDTLELRLK
jgi:hypothetical protein